ncbi:MAG: MobA/MobL family protein [Cloacibacillus porcorum]|uniref:MobQ family relaxase n=1 Tax=Cloacibacillus porcorum TaxID=1197717 RepID=UPI00235356D6|nr:MobQ family relaxase [Cloacibacillus porcorum]MCI5864805.1 MobA/MobL family protein [Cloacibacillus porcorum]
MAIYHLEAKVVSRGHGRSAVAASAYLSCSNILNDYDGVRHDYTRKKGLVWQEVFLPEYAPAEWQDRGVLWNAVEENEKAKDSRLAREFVPALPVELNKEQWRQLLSDFINEQFVADGMCADVAIHDPYPPGHNPHAHIMLTVRPLDENGKWQYKTEKEYLCIKDSEERGFTAAEFKAAQADGWEKQYQYKVSKKKVYMTPSAAEAQGYERVNKYPKSTKYGRQNPISERWNSEEQLVEWRKAWADVTNRYLEQYGHDARIDHRSHAERGLDEQPTVHEGVIARALEQKGIVSDWCELNRQIKADNALLRELKAAVKKLMQAVKNTLPAIAEAMERLRSNMMIFKYQLLHIGGGKQAISKSLKMYREDMAQYTALADKISKKSKERKAALDEKKATSVIHVLKHRELAKRIAELTEDLEELRTEESMLLRQLKYPEDATADMFRKEIRTLEDGLKKLETNEAKYAAELDNALKQYAELQEQAAEFDPIELYEARQEIRSDHERDATRRIQDAYGNKYDILRMHDSKRDVADLLHEEAEACSIRERLRQKQQSKAQHQRKPKHNEPER